MTTTAQLYACDGCPLKAGCLLEPFQHGFLGPEAWFLAAAPRWRAEPDGAGGWRAQPETGGSYWPLTQEASWCCRVCVAPAIPLSGPAAAWFPLSSTLAA